MSASEEARRYRLIQQLVALPFGDLPHVEALFQRLATHELPQPIFHSPAASASDNEFPWPHAPTHRLRSKGTYFITTGTYLKRHLFRSAERLDQLQHDLLSDARDTGWQLEAWAVFSNHYHFVAHALDGAIAIQSMLKELHRKTAGYVNDLDGEPGRQVWHNFWDTELTIETSYFARLAYVHNNPVKHGLVRDARHYKWCSASWFERVATRAQVATLSRIKTDKVNAPDDYEPVVEG